MTALEITVNAAEMYQSLYPLDCGLLIVNKDGIIVKYVQAKTFGAKREIGEKIQSGNAADKVLKTGQPYTGITPKGIHGGPFKAVGQPIIENGEVIGAVVLVATMDLQQSLHESTQTIAATTKEIAAAAEELATTACHLAEDLDSLKQTGKVVIKNIQSTDEILHFVSAVSANSNLLGLNAAIEAARAGEQGRGFAVVAGEIRKMADNSSTAVANIKEILSTISQEVACIVDIIDRSALSGERQAAASEEISSSLEQLVSAANHIEKIAKIV